MTQLYRKVEYNECPINIRLSDKWISLTDMWKVQGSPTTKRVNDWLNNDSTKEFLATLINDGELEVSKVVDTRKGRNGGTFAMKAVADKYWEYLLKTGKDICFTEKGVQASLANSIDFCEREVITPAGIIDILTSEEIIEVKHWKEWKNAIGQVMVYGLYYPSHKKRIHLFGSAHSDFLPIVIDSASKLGVSVTWE